MAGPRTSPSSVGDSPARSRPWVTLIRLVRDLSLRAAASLVNPYMYLRLCRNIPRPLPGLSKDLDLTEMKRYREAEVTHGRVSMLAVLGFLVAESFHPLFGGSIAGPAIRHLDQVRVVAPAFFEILALARLKPRLKD